MMEQMERSSFSWLVCSLYKHILYQLLCSCVSIKRYQLNLIPNDVLLKSTMDPLLPFLYSLFSFSFVWENTLFKVYIKVF